ncbi:MAG: glycosyltransferase N-terminal domain-containing protein, partial [Pseudomonadota bacterium]
MRSLSLKAYKALSRNASDAGQQTRPSRPPGVLIWIMVHHEEELRAALYLHDRLVQTHGPSSLLLTLLWDTPLTEPQGVLCERLASDQTQYAQGFLDHWQPDICIWMSGNLKPSLIAEARSRKIPLFLLGAESESLERSTGRWVPGLTRDTLGAFDLITAASPEAERMMRKALPRSGDIQLSAPLQIASPAPPVAQDRFQDLSDMISGRSV